MDGNGRRVPHFGIDIKLPATRNVAAFGANAGIEAWALADCVKERPDTRYWTGFGLGDRGRALLYETAEQADRARENAWPYLYVVRAPFLRGDAIQASQFVPASEEPEPHQWAPSAVREADEPASQHDVPASEGPELQRGPLEQAATAEAKDPLPRIEKTMTKIEKTTYMLKNSCAEAGKLVAADQAGDALVAIAKRALGDRYPDMLGTPVGDDVAKLLVATLVHLAVTDNPGLIKNPVMVQAACSYLSMSSMQRLVELVVVPLRENLEVLSAFGANVALAQPQEGTGESDS